MSGSVKRAVTLVTPVTLVKVCQNKGQKKTVSGMFYTVFLDPLTSNVPLMYKTVS